MRSLLKGVIFGPDGHALIHTFVHRPRATYRYYVAGGEHRYGCSSDPSWRFRAGELERCVVEMVQNLVPAAAHCRSDEERAGVARSLLARVDVGLIDLTVRLTTGAVLTSTVVGRVGSGSKA